MAESSAAVSPVKREAITLWLRDAIIKGVIQPGQPLRQDRIARQFGVSHIPVREALRQLVSEGLAVARHNRGVVVSELSAQQAWELTEFRALLEVQMARWAVPRLARAHLAEALAAIERIESVTDTDEIIRLNAEFHRILYEPAGRPLILHTIEQLRRNLERYLRLAWLKLDYLPKSQAEHRNLLRLFSEGDEARVGEAIGAHIAATGRIIVQYLEGASARRTGT